MQRYIDISSNIYIITFSLPKNSLQSSHGPATPLETTQSLENGMEWNSSLRQKAIVDAALRLSDHCLQGHPLLSFGRILQCLLLPFSNDVMRYQSRTPLVIYSGIYRRWISSKQLLLRNSLMTTSGASSIIMDPHRALYEILNERPPEIPPEMPYCLPKCLIQHIKDLHGAT